MTVTIKYLLVEGTNLTRPPHQTFVHSLVSLGNLRKRTSDIDTQRTRHVRNVHLLTYHSL